MQIHNANSFGIRSEIYYLSLISQEHGSYKMYYGAPLHCTVSWYLKNYSKQELNWHGNNPRIDYRTKYDLMSKNSFRLAQLIFESSYVADGNNYGTFQTLQLVLLSASLI